MNRDPTLLNDRAAAILMAFAERTGLTGGGVPRRYLWTDAFAVCTLLGLARATGESRFLDLGLALVDQVHHVLGRFRTDDPRSGWISGLSDPAGETRPTAGGLRIGKRDPERAPGEPLDPRREWDRDGQYFHYLTKWMYALDQVARGTGDAKFNLWARELADAAHRAFVHGSPDRRRMAWKMSTDLSRPLVPSMGQHDPLDGYLTCLQLEATARGLSATPLRPRLDRAIEAFGALSRAIDIRTIDPLGLGGLLTDAFRVFQLEAEGALGERELLGRLLAASLEGLALYARSEDLRQPAWRRLAFRELGLAIGLAAIDRLEESIDTARSVEPEASSRIAALRSYVPLGEAIESFWLDPEHRRTPAWSEHPDINDVMLATRLAPIGYLELAPA